MIEVSVDTRIMEGLREDSKSIPSRYFYDARGDELFQQIMAMPEYYLTRAEHEILKEQSGAIIQAAGLNATTPFTLVELGAGDGIKTKELLRYLIENAFDFVYQPVDISGNAIELLKENLSDLPAFKLEPLVGDYFEMLQRTLSSKLPKMVLFLGSNLGNYNEQTAETFLKGIADNMRSKDTLLLGLDLVKNPKRILDAYNDAAGITAAFNLNLLERMNRELNANFNLNQFEHAPEFVDNKAISYLVSKVDQIVHFGVTDECISFEKDEKIFTEISMKYTPEIVEALLPAGLGTVRSFQDSNNDFADYLLRKA